MSIDFRTNADTAKKTKRTKGSNKVDLFSFCKEYFSRVTNDDTGDYKTYQEAYIEKNIINKRVGRVKSEKQRVKKTCDGYLNKVHVLRKITLENQKLWRINKTEN